MFFNKPVVLFVCLVTIIGVPMTTFAETKPFPTVLESCLDREVSQLFGLNGHDRSIVKKYFLAAIDQKKLGYRAYGGRNWLNFSPAEKKVALDIYFDLLYQEGSSFTQGMKDIRNTVISKRLADRPVVSKKTGDFHIIIKILLDNGKSMTVAVLLTKDCKVFDFGQGTFASRFVNATDVDQAMRMRRKLK